MIFPFVLSLACTAPTSSPADDDTALETVTWAEGSPEALGIVAMLNDASITLTILDIDAALDKRAATGLIAHRDGADAVYGTSDDNHYGTLAEVDAVSYVGDSALSALLAYARAHGWVSPVDDYYGTIESVTFTSTEAADIVALANTASLTTLDVSIGLDSRAASNIIAGRSYTTLEQVAAVKYVGTSALTDLKDWVDAASIPDLTTSGAAAALTADVAGLLYTSESDYPLLVWQIAAPSSTVLTTSNVQSVLASAYVAHGGTAFSARSVESTTLSAVLDRYTVPQDWWDDSYLASQASWVTVRDVFELQLQEVTVWRFGRRNSSGDLTGDIDIFIVGVSSDGGLVGISTISIET